MTSAMQLVVFPVKDLEAAKALFSTLLGTQPSMDEPYYVGYRTGSVEFGLDPNGHAKGATGPICYWTVPDIDASITSLVAAGAEVSEAPHNVGGGKRVATLTDADGNQIGLAQSS